MSGEPKKPHRWFLLLGLVPIIAVVLFVLSALRPLPAIAPVQHTVKAQPKTAVALTWPAYGESAVGAAGYGLLETSGEQTSVPMASVAKVVTALAVLQKKPLGANQQGPTLTMSADDVALHDKYFSEGGSIVEVQQGEQLSEYQALQALLLPSANNMADSLAIWAFGSMDNYLTYANQWLTSQGLDNTHMDDASGFSPKTVSSASDLVRLGDIALKNAAMVSIVKQQSASLPVAGTVNNTNWLINEDGVFGIKTGNTEQAKGCYLFAAKRTVNNQPVTVIGAVMGAPDLNTAIKDSRPLISSMDGGFKTVTLVKKGQVFGEYSTPWGASARAVSQKDIKVLAWQDSDYSQLISLAEISAPMSANTSVGIVKVTYGNQSSSSALVLDRDVKKPALTWRALH